MRWFSRKGKSHSDDNIKDRHPTSDSNNITGISNNMHDINSTLSSFASKSLPKALDPSEDPAGYLRSIHAVRERSHLMLQKAKENRLRHFIVVRKAKLSLPLARIYVHLKSINV